MRLTNREKKELKLKLLEYIEEYMNDVTNKENNLGWIPTNLEDLMTDAAFAVLETVNETNVYYEEQDLLK